MGLRCVVLLDLHVADEPDQACFGSRRQPAITGPNTPPPQLDPHHNSTSFFRDLWRRPVPWGQALQGTWIGGGYWPYIADQLPRGQRVRCDLPAPVDDHRPVADRVTAVEGGGPTSLKRWITSRTDHAGLRRPRDRWRSRAGPLAPGGPTPVASSPAGSAPNSHCPNSVCRGFCFSWPFSLRARACSATAPQRSERTSPTANRHDLPNSTNRAITALAPRAHPPGRTGLSCEGPDPKPSTDRTVPALPHE